MDVSVDMSDKNAWDDSLLIDSWNDAVTEYKKYHSIYKSGKRLEDLLTKDELTLLRDDYKDVLEEPEIDMEIEDDDASVDKLAVDASVAESGDIAHVMDAKREQQKLESAGQQQEVRLQSAEPKQAASIPESLLGTVKDENLRNIMMSWYYAGYYTGLHVGQQQSKDVISEQ